MKRQGRHTISFIFATVLAASAHAGTQLQFLQGSYDPALTLQTQSVEPEKSGDYVIQFKKAITLSDHVRLANAGIKVFRYLPEDALIVRATAADLQKIKDEVRVRAIVPFETRFKISPNLPTLSVFSQNQRTATLFTFFQASDRAAFQRTLPASVEVLEGKGRHLSVMMNPSLVLSLASHQGVEFVQEIEEMVPFNVILDEGAVAEPSAAGDYTDLTGFETGTKLMGFEAAWAQNFTGQGQIVAMADTGLDSGHENAIHADFMGAITKGYSFGLGAQTWDDPMGHGTHVAGSVLSRGTTSKGLLKGGAFNAQMIPQGMWSPIINNLTVPPKLAGLFDAANNDGARVHTNSWGSPRNLGAYESMSAQVDEFMFDHPEFLVIFAAGNSGIDRDKNGVIDAGSVSAPGTAKNALTVGASENQVSTGGIQKFIKELGSAPANWPAEPIWSSKLSDNENGIACFSSRGPTLDGRLKPEIVAPGTNILSTMSQVKGASPLWGLYNKDYTYSGGTSMATPLVAGAAAVTRQILVERFKMATPSAAMVKATLIHTAKDLFPGQYGEGSATQELTRRPNKDEGYGRVDMDRMTQLTADHTTFVDNTTGVATGASFTATVKVAEGQSLLINLVYTDKAATPSAAKTLVNDLDLSLANGTSVVAESNDDINNTKIIETAALAAGEYTITVKGTNVPMGVNGQQPFALVYSVR